MEVTLSNGKTVLKADYVRAKTKDLIEFGYANLTEDDVLDQVSKIINGDEDLSVIGLFCKDDFEV